MKYQIETRDHIFTAHLQDDLTFQDHAMFRPILSQAENTLTHTIVINLMQLRMIDSAGLGMLLVLRDKCYQHHKKLMLLHPVGQVRKVFSIAKFEHLFNVEQ